MKGINGKSTTRGAVDGKPWLQALVDPRAAGAVSHGHQEDQLMQQALSDVAIKRAPAGAVQTSLYPADGFTARA
jgi:hypothetical protein